MNVKECIEVKRNPALFYYAVEELVLGRQEIAALPALVSELVDMSILAVRPSARVGRVLLFNVEPYKHADPPLIYCRAIDLRAYYDFWNLLVSNIRDDCGRPIASISKFDDVMSRLNISALREDEGAFLLIEMLKFKNEYVRRA